MKPVLDSLTRHPNAKEKEYLFSAKLQISIAGKEPINNQEFKTMSVNDIFPILCFLGVENSTCVSMLSALLTIL